MTASEQAFRPEPDEVGVDHVRCGCGQTSLTVTRNNLPGATVRVACPACLDVIELLASDKP